MISLEISRKEKYLRYIEECLFFKGGRWIANFDVAIRDFNIKKVMKDKSHLDQSKDFSALIYGGVKGKGFILSRAFAFLASPTYIVACAVIDLQRAKSIKWSAIVDWIRQVRNIMDIMEFEWSWIVFFGEGNLPDKVLGHFQKFNQREIGLVYANLTGIEVYNSDCFIGRRGAKLFHPKNVDRKGFSFKFWRKN
ncbi:MAG: hypothetical protein ACFFDT_09930 [Candidatus Hodarchaeota archaeon]